MIRGELPDGTGFVANGIQDLDLLKLILNTESFGELSIGGCVRARGNITVMGDFTVGGELLLDILSISSANRRISLYRIVKTSVK